MNYKLLFYRCILICTLSKSCLLLADSQLIDKVYHPYVLANERELEIRTHSRSSSEGNELSQRIGYGFSINEHIAIEAYLIGDRDVNGNFALRSYEGEMRWMLTEQGQYDFDAALLFEVEKDNSRDVWEVTSGLLLEKEFLHTSLTGNFIINYNQGNFAEKKVNSQVRLQYRYRLKPAFEPAVELYRSEDFVGIGPAFMGVKKFTPYKRLKWEAGFILGFNGNNRDNNLRFSLEYEF